MDNIDARIGAARFPFPIPFGWFSIGRLHELPTDLVPAAGESGAVWAFHAVGRELIAWHDGDEYRVADAFCPHLGAHLGVGGRVDDGCLVCPFHGWTYDGTGANASIPFSDRTNAKATLRMYPSDVSDGHLRIWYHPDPAVAPMWEIPGLIGDDMVRCGSADWTVGAYWQEMAENSVDMAHFVSVHGTPALGEVGHVVDDGPFRKVVNKTVYSTPRGDVDGELQVEMYGPGTSVTTFTLFGTVSLLATTTPIDDGQCRVRFDYFHDGDDLSATVAAGFAKEVDRQFEQDVPIWENKRYVASPALSQYERPITEFRAWASQFYAAAP
ncbi:MAG: Rieske 2Fe-2S domain-containing protein [Ilumatobacter sp.]|nr:Rieske 2Fe-2S domain-containing protein [Ilumatobacter sp.]